MTAVAWLIPAVLTLAAVAAWLILSRRSRDKTGSEEIYDLCAGCWDDSAHCDGVVGSCCCTCGWDEDWAEEDDVPLLPPERSPEELGFITERMGPAEREFWHDLRERGPYALGAERLADTDVRKTYAVYRSPARVPRAVPDVPGTCRCGRHPAHFAEHLRTCDLQAIGLAFTTTAFPAVTG